MFKVLRIVALAVAASVCLWGAATDARADATCDPGSGAVAVAEPLEGQTCSGDLVILAGTTSTLNGSGTLTVTGNMTVETGALLNVLATPDYALLDVGGDLTVETNATVNLDGQSAVTQPSGTAGAGQSGYYCGGGGAGHGGAGGVAGNSSRTILGGSTYGTPGFASLPGSSGGYGTLYSTLKFAGGKGGGSLRIVVGGLSTLDGLITANGRPGQDTPNYASVGGAGGGGSGGAIYLRTADLTTHNPGVHLSVAGGAGGNNVSTADCGPGGGGGGGRISVYYSGTNGTGTGVALDAASHLDCAGGAKGATSAYNGNGGAGTCLLSALGAGPSLDSVTPDHLGQGAVNQTLTLTGGGYTTGSQVSIGGAELGRPANGITIGSVSVPSATTMTVVVSVDLTADASAGANPKAVHIINPDLTETADEFLFTVTPGPVVDHVEQGGATITGLPRGFSGTIIIHGSNFQVGAVPSFGTGSITVTETPSVDVAAQTITVAVSVSPSAPSGDVPLDVTNPDGGRTATSTTLQVFSDPQITGLAPDTLIVGQTSAPVTITGSGFVSAATVLTDNPDVTVNSVRFDGFGQLTATLSVAVSADLTTATRSLRVDNGDGGVSPPATLFLSPVPPGLNSADLVYSGGGALTPPDRLWNGFGWSVPGTATGALPEAPAWVITRPGKTAGDLLLATVDATRRLYLQERTGSTWGTPVGPTTLAPAPGRPVDAAAVAGTAGERFLAVYGPAGSGALAYRTFGGAGATGAVPATDPACTGGTEITWVRVVANGTGDRAVVAYAPDNQALCAITWNGTAFDPATETVLAPAGGLAASATQAFDATYWGATAPQRAMVAWGLAGSGSPRYAVWDGAAWTAGTAQSAASSPTATLAGVRLAASVRSDRVALVNVTAIGELYAQFWGGTRWGSTVGELPFALASNPVVVAGATTTRAFDAAWSTTTDAATVVFGVTGTPGTTSRSWSLAGGWGTATTMTPPSGAGDAGWVQLRSDRGSGDLLAGVVDGGGTLAYYHWNGAAWGPASALGTAAPTATESYMVAYRAVTGPPALSISTISYAGVSPAVIGARSSGQVVTIEGTGFLNPATVTFGDSGIHVDALNYVATNRLLATVSIGDVTPGTYILTLQNADGATATATNGLTVVAPPSTITVRLGAGAPACTPSASTATACAFQDTAAVPVEVLGTGFVDGAGVDFGASGVNFVGSAGLSTDPGTGMQVLSGSVDVAGTAALGAGNVTVTNPDSSTGTGTGVFEVMPLVTVTSVTPSVLGAGARGQSLEVLGRNFQIGVNFDLGAGVLVNSVTRNGPTQVFLDVDVSSAATPGSRTATATNPDGGGSGTTGAGLFSVAVGPTVTAVSPTEGSQGSTVSVVVDGANLAPLASGGVSFSSTGITVSNIVASSGQVTFDAAIAADAAFDHTYDLTLVRDNGGQVTVPGVFSVVATPVISTLTPATVVAGELGRPIVLAGLGFHPDAVVVADPGVVVRSQQVVGPTEIDITVDVGSGTGTVNLSVANPSGAVSAPKALTVTAAAACTAGTGVTLTITPAGPLSCSSLDVSGTGTVVLSGNLTLNVLGDATLSGGTLVADPASTYVRLKVGGNLTVASGALIEADGTGYAGGRLGAKGGGSGGGIASSTGGNDSGRGGGYGGAGGNGVSTGGGPTNDLFGVCTDPGCFTGMPLNMGSGGGSGFENTFSGRQFWRQGGNGGGSIVLDVAGTVALDGTVRANGTDGAVDSETSTGGVRTAPTGGRGAGGGSGGAVLVLAGSGLSGAGTIQALGADGTPTLSPTTITRHGTGGGGGRIALYSSGPNTFSGTLDCAGGTSLNPDAAYQGAAGTCLSPAVSTITSLSPNSVAQGASLTVTVTGTGLAAGDTVSVPGGGFTWGPLTGTGPFTATLDVDPAAALGLHDVVVRHADQSGVVTFSALTVVANPRALSMTPDHLAQGVTAGAVLSGGLLQPVGATVRFLRGGTEVMCGGVACVAATVDAGASSADALSLTLTVAGTALVGGYDVEVNNADGGRTVLSHGFTVVSASGTVPAISDVTPDTVGAEVTGGKLALSGYDFGVPPTFQVDGLATSDANVTLAFDPAGCPLTPADCVTAPGGLQRIDALVSTVGATPGTVVDVSVSAGAATSTLVGALTVNARPVVTGFTPTSGSSSFTITVSGTNFATNAIVSVDDPTVDVGQTTPSGANLVTTVIVPPSAPTATTQVRVTNPDGGFGVLDGLTVNPAPTLSSIGPPASAGLGQTVTIGVHGANFHAQAAVSFGAGVTVSGISVLSSAEIQATLSVASGAATGTRDVTVTNPNGQSAVLAGGFTVRRPLVLSSMTPSAVGAGGSHVLLLQGAEFDSALTSSNVTISGTGITKQGLFNYRATPVGSVTITSVDLAITVGATAATGSRTLTLVNSDGSQGSLTFTVDPAPVITYADPNVAVRGQAVTVSLNGFSLDTVAPRVCFGTGCDFGASSSSIFVTGITPVHTNRVDVSLLVDPAAPLGWQPVTLANRDGGRVTKTNVLEVVAGFTVDRIAGFEIPIGAGPVAQTLTGTGFVNTPAAPQVAFLLPSGAVDPDVAVTTTYTSATAMDLSITVGAGAAPGFRILRVTNGSGAILDLTDFLLISKTSGPTVGALEIPDGGGGFVPAVLGLDEAATRVITGARLTGSGLDGSGLTLTFGTAGVSATDVVVAGGGKTATLSLNLAPTTTPGTVALTASTTAGSDTRSDALTVNPGPGLTALQPATLTPGTTQVSVLIDGSGFQAGAQVAVTPAASGVTVRDLDSSVAGTQASFLSTSALRTLVDVATTASGSYTLAVTNPDGGRGAIALPVAAPVLGTPAKFAYLAETATTGLKVRDWIGAPQILDPITSASADMAYSSAVADQWTELRANPMDPGQYLLAVASTSLAVLRTLPDGTTWTQIDAVGSLSSTRTQPFDLAYEQAGPGRALLVYGSGTSLFYHTIDAGGPSGGTPVTVGAVAPLATGAPQWVRLIPQPGTQRILVMYMTDSLQVQALVWDGAAGGGTGAFVSQYDGGGVPLTTNAVPAEANAGGAVKPGFDGAWEGTSGRAVVFWSVNGTNALSAVTWDPVDGWGTPSQSDVRVTGTGPTFVEADADPGSDRIGVLATPDNGAVARPLVGRFYAGGWETPGTELAQNTTLDAATRTKPGRNFDLAWDDSGGLVTLYDNTWPQVFVLESRRETRRWTPSGGWTAAAELLLQNQLITAVEIAPDPETGELLAAMAFDPGGGSAVLPLRMLRWTGHAWQDEATLTTGASHWITFGSGGIVYGTGAAVAYREDLVPPAAVTLSQTGSTSTTATVAWTAPGDNGTSGRAGGYDIRWSDRVIVDDAAAGDCASLPSTQVCFSQANQVRPSPTPKTAGSAESAQIDLGAPGVYTVAVKTGDRANLVDSTTGAETARRNVSALSNVLTVATLAADPIPPEAVADLAAADGPNPESMVALTWTGVGDDGGVTPTGPVLGYDLRMASLPISEVGGDTNFHVPFDKATHVAVAAPAVDGSGGTRGVVNSYTVTGLATGSTYYFAVKGLDEDPTTPAAISNVASHTTAVVTPEVIDDLAVAGTDVNTVTLTWTARGGSPTSYELRFATFPITAANFASAIPVGGVPTPAASGIRQVFTVAGLLPDTPYYLGLVPVRYQTIGGVFTRLAPAPAVVAALTQPDPTGNPTQPSAVTDLAVVAGTVRTNDVRLSWTAPATVGAQAQRYEFRWAYKPLATATAGEIQTVPVTLLPGKTGAAQEYTVTGLPENALVYLSLVSYDSSGLASALSNEVRLHTALRRGMDALSVPGSLAATDIATVLGPYVGSCTSSGTFGTGSGPVGPCGVGETTVTAFRWDPTAGTAGDFVAMAQTDALSPGIGIFVHATGNQSVVEAVGADLPSFPAVPIPQNAPALVANPYQLPVAVANLRVQGDDGYDQPFGTAVTDGIIDPTLLFFTLDSGVLKFVPVTSGDSLLAYRAYFIQLGALADPAVQYQLEVLHP